jgi:hypothetical protein
MAWGQPLWNWKTAALSAAGRASLFALAGLHSSPSVALKAMLTELALAALLGGFQGALLQSLRGVTPVWRANLLSIAMIAAVVHPAELLAHTLLRNPERGLGLLLSWFYTICAAQFTLHLMRRGLLITGLPRPRRSGLVPKHS